MTDNKIAYQPQAVLRKRNALPSARLTTKRDFKKNWSLYLIVLPVVAYYIIFAYMPMYGAVIAFKSFSLKYGILGSPWVGFRYFEQFFTSPYFKRILLNTLRISGYSILFGFPAPIILALLINEIKSRKFVKFVQTASYLPHFISLVVVCSLIREFTVQDGLINDFFAMFGAERTNMLSYSSRFTTIYVLSGIWQELGWGAIIYLAALTGVDQEIYEAARIDGAGRWRQTLHVTLPGIMPTVVVMLILTLGGTMSVGFEKIILLYSPLTYDKADVISSFVYRVGLKDQNYSYSAAVGLFNSVINFALIVAANMLSRRVGETSLW